LRLSNRLCGAATACSPSCFAAVEFPIALVFPFEVEQLEAARRTVEWSNSSDPIVTSINVVALRPSPSSEQRQLLINYILSEEGQNIIKNVSRVPIRPGVKRTSPSSINRH
jgi:ABC-type Fe3+ transport system substrate-binding protein